MAPTAPDPVSTHRSFSALEWAAFRDDTPLALTQAEIEKLRSMGDHVDVAEAERIYLPLSRLLSAHVEALLSLFERRKSFLSVTGTKTPFVVGIAGSVAVGKSTTARLLQALMQRWPASPKVDLITTDGFLLPNAELEARGLMTRKGFPESYDRAAMIQFMSSIKAGRRRVEAPLYSHLVYDVLPDNTALVDQPDILIFEGLNVLQVPQLEAERPSSPVVSDYFDFSIYVDADSELIHHWYVTRFMRLRDTAFSDPTSFFHKYSKLSDDEAIQVADRLWSTINLVNLTENILPTRERADLILHKGADHLVHEVALRRL